MSVVAQLCLISAICVAAEGISAVLPFTFPSSVVGMVLLLILLLTRALKPKQLKETSDFLLNNMTMFFIPTCVSILNYADVLFQNFWAIVGISLLTTPLVFFITGHVVQLTMKQIRKKEEKNHA